MLASHYLEAYNAAPEAADADEIRTQAREKLSAPPTSHGPPRSRPGGAQRYFEQAAELADDDVMGAGLQGPRTGRWRFGAPGVDEARALFDRAHSTFQSPG